MNKSTCVVMMPAEQKFQELHNQIILPLLEDLGMESEIALCGDRVNMDSILSKIKSCDFLIAELTCANPYILCGIGMALSIDKPVISITRIEPDAPIDIRTFTRYIYYDVQMPEAMEGLKLHLKIHVESIAENTYKFPQIYNDVIENGGYEPYALNGMWKGNYANEKEGTICDLSICINNSIAEAVVVLTQKGKKATIRQNFSVENANNANFKLTGTAYSFLNNEILLDYYLLDIIDVELKHNKLAGVLYTKKSGDERIEIVLEKTEFQQRSSK